ncbi:EAL domain-containing protein [Spongiibacter sp. KMU-166]|uniref:cyclic-guanylate-specific phosphodiesterase n=2 Tax=Spongiibacter thalassae TaxID=2721624 RepID=A0ABX1GGN5_9GAMM|nr:EAL domain-containing protein [Spongiibacter thalassae]
MFSRRARIYIALFAAAMTGFAALFSLIGWYLWHQSVVAEEERLQRMAERLGQQAEHTIIDARALLNQLNELSIEACSQQHLDVMQEVAVARPYVRGIGYWRAADRQCGIGFAQNFTPAKASRIYASGIVAWWPGKDTEISGVPLFLMRYGRHDVVIDPRLLMDRSLLENREAGLWVEHLLMVTTPRDAVLPAPSGLKSGLTIDSAEQRVIARFSLGTIFPIDVVVVQPMRDFWQNYLPSILTAGVFGLLVIGLCMFGLMQFSRRKLSLASELKEAIVGGEIKASYQPIVDLHTGRCVGAESLARWTRYNGEVVGPDVFVPLAEESGLLTGLTTAMLTEIVSELGGLLRENPDLSINLNISAQDIESEEFSDVLSKTLLDSGVHPKSIKLEITERALVDSDEARGRISRFRQRGHAIAIDDFGTGYSSLSYLESFEIDALKIDKVFVDAIETHAVTSNVIPHVIDMAKSLELDIIAEGIESRHQADWLSAQGVNLGQGYLFAKPLYADEFIKFYLVDGKRKGG